MEKILCPGEMLIDYFVSPDGDHLRNGYTYQKKAGGASANVAIAIQKLGAEGIFLGAVGNDAVGNFLVDTLMNYQASIKGVKQLHTNTTLAYVTLFEDGERDFEFVKGAASDYTFDMISDDLLERVSIIHFGSAMAFMGGELEKTYDQLLDYALHNHIMVSFDPNYRDVLFGDKQATFIEKSVRYIKHADIVKVSDEDASIITGEEDIEKAAKAIVDMGAKNVLVTLGKKGTLFVTSNHLEYVPVIPVKMVDATGAGDAFIGAVLAQLAKHKDTSIEAMKDYIAFGNKVGSITVQKKGALDSIPFIHEL